MSFDVKSLFTSIPLQLVIDCLETTINNSTIELLLATDGLMDLLNLCLTSTLTFNTTANTTNSYTEQLWAHQFPLLLQKSLCTENIEERALTTYKTNTTPWLRYVDDIFTAVHKDEIDDFHEHLNGQNTGIQFTRKIEENGKIPFLDCLVRLLDYSTNLTTLLPTKLRHSPYRYGP